MLCLVTTLPTPTGQGSENEMQRIYRRGERHQRCGGHVLDPSIGVVLVPQMITETRFLHTECGDTFETHKRSATDSFSRVIGRDYYFDGTLSHTPTLRRLLAQSKTFARVHGPLTTDARPASCGFCRQSSAVTRRSLLHPAN